MDVREALGQARDAMTVKRVFGDPYERDGLVILPVANVMGGAGGGGGTGPAGSSDALAEVTPTPSGYGMGYGLRATPAGVYVIRGGEVEWKPAVDTNRLARQRTLTAIVALLVLRSIVRTIARR